MTDHYSRDNVPEPVWCWGDPMWNYRPDYGPNGGDLMFHFIRVRRSEGESFNQACRSVRRDYPQLFPPTSSIGIS